MISYPKVTYMLKGFYFASYRYIPRVGIRTTEASTLRLEISNKTVPTRKTYLLLGTTSFFNNRIGIGGLYQRLGRKMQKQKLSKTSLNLSLCYRNKPNNKLFVAFIATLTVC